MKKFFITLLTLFVATSLWAQQSDNEKEYNGSDVQEGWTFRLSAGYSIGGTAPLPMPREIRAINSYTPGLNYQLGFSARRDFENSKWGVGFGLRIDKKGMSTDADTKSYHMEAWNSDGKVVGAFTGKVETEVSSYYVTLPMLATYDFSSRWGVSGGIYLSYLLEGDFKGCAYDGYIRDQNPTGERTDVTRAYYGFGDDLCDFLWGLQLGCEYSLNRNFDLFACLQWGMNGIFPSKFKSVTFNLYPIYATFGVAYAL